MTKWLGITEPFFLCGQAANNDLLNEYDAHHLILKGDIPDRIRGLSRYNTRHEN